MQIPFGSPPSAPVSGTGPAVALIGFGAIGAVLARGLMDAPPIGRLLGVLVRERHRIAARSELPEGVSVVTQLAELLALRPDIIVECAGQGAVRAFGAAILEAGRDLVIVSSGALADQEIQDGLLAAAERGGGRLTIAPGAIAGLDGLGALKHAGLAKVTYTSVKPPFAWRGTPAEALLDLESLIEPTVFFEGTAREAALAYPKNANLAATVALAGLGLDRTLVRLVADPQALGNRGTIEAESAAGSLTVTMAGAASANPKTSASTAFSLLHLLSTRNARLVV